MGEPLFLSQAKLEALIDGGEVTFIDDVLTIQAQKRSFKLTPAARITSIIDGQDVHGLLGRVVAKGDLEALGAEHYPGSIIVGDSGFECEDGFVGTEQLAAAPEAPPELALPEHAPPPPPPAPPAAADPQSDMDLLADFLLKHL